MVAHNNIHIYNTPELCWKVDLGLGTPGLGNKALMAIDVFVNLVTTKINK